MLVNSKDDRDCDMGGMDMSMLHGEDQGEDQDEDQGEDQDEYQDQDGKEE